ncbi:hypothetical protein QFC20_002014 [Naganishia adeliensis]|uniref:Uncharacterized protein n=1 Tax=Naganishia adeliensis TaxID=92952 RepID=A0ACC2WN08_9TREE|nr:hypothetical protein QFC20_002014 [Naganishia adeliensis]
MSKNSGSSALLRTLRIKTSSLARLQKDVTAYTADTTTAQQSVEKWRNTDPNDRDENWEWNVKNAEKVVKDCQQMIPLTKEKAQAALEELGDMVETLKAEGDEEVLRSSEYENACKALETAHSHGDAQ